MQALMTRIKERARRRAALSDRKSAAAQARMKSIANLANDDRVPKKKRKGGGEDMFGADDADWAIYRKIVRFPCLCPSVSTTYIFPLTIKSGIPEHSKCIL